MSIQVMTQVWKRAPYDGSTLLVLLALADWGDDDGDRIYPRIDTLAAKARVSVRTAQTALRQLETDGILSVIEDRQGGRGNVTRYQLHVDRLEQMPAIAKGENPAPFSKGANSDVKGCSLRPERVQSTDPHLIEPLGKPLRESLGAAIRSTTPDRLASERARPIESSQVLTLPAPRVVAPAKRRTRLPDECPDNAAREAAVTFWRSLGRSDIRLEDQVAKFRAWHRGRGDTQADWGSVWESWYLGAPEKVRMPLVNGKANGSAPVENCTREGWVIRLEMFEGKNAKFPAGTWDAKWGPLPGQPGCAVPDPAIADFRAKHGHGRAAAI